MYASFHSNCCQHGGRKGFYLGHVSVNAHLLSRDVSEEEFSSGIIRAAEHTNNRKSLERETDRAGNIKMVSFDSKGF